MKPIRLVYLMAFVILLAVFIGDPHARPNVSLPWVRTASQAQITGQPTLSANFMNQVLAAAHSPAAGTGQALYADGVHYGIDPAYALAFFKHESSFGTTGVARFTRSLGNIRCTPGYACIDGFRAYSSWPAGYADWFDMMHTLYISEWHLTTLQQIIPTYAPASDGNDPQNYISSVVADVARWQRGEL